MNLKYRRLIYLSFIAAFVILTPIVALYTAGYRYNFKKNKLEKTGILYIDSRPKGAFVFINEKYKNKTPARFSQMMTDVYKVSVRKEGYHSWEKNLEVKSNLTTFAKNITLFKNTLPTIMVEGEISLLNISPDKKTIIYSLVKNKTEELRVINPQTNSDFLIKKLNRSDNQAIKFVGWSPNANKFVVQETIDEFNRYYLIDIETLKTKDLFDITRLNFKQLKWGNDNDNYLYGQTETSILQIDLVNSQANELLNKKVTDFQVKGESFYYINQENRDSFLNKKSIAGLINLENKNLANKIKLPSSTTYALLDSPVGSLALLDQKNNDLFIINENSFNQPDLTNNILLQDKAKKLIWFKDNKNLLYYADFEIWTFNLESRQKNLVTRYGGTLNEAIWYFDQHYIIYQIGDEIRSTETSLDESKNDIKLTNAQSIGALFIDNRGKALYFKGQIGNQKGIYKLDLQ